MTRNDRYQLAMLIVIGAAFLIAIAFATGYRLDPVWYFVLAAVALSLILVLAYANRGSKDEFQWAQYRWIGSWGASAAGVILVALSMSFRYAPAQTRALENFMKSFSHSNDSYADGLFAGVLILLLCQGLARVFWWLKHR